MTQIATFNSVKDLFAANLDDLADIAGFEAPPEGSYILSVTASVKKINQKDAVEASFEVVETVELKTTGDKPATPGTKFSTLFQLDNEFGVGNLKKFLAPFQEHYRAAGIGALLEELKGVTIAGTVKHRKDKNDPDKVYGSVINITVN
jgi:hypothetical protein